MSEPAPRSPAPTRSSRLLAGLATFVSAWPRLVVAGAAARAFLAAPQVPYIEVTPSRTNIGPAVNDAGRRFGEFLDEFGSPNDLIAVIDGAGADELEHTADELAADLNKDTAHVRGTFH